MTNPPQPKHHLGERLFVAAVGVFFAVQFILALSYPADPRLFPLIITGVGVLVAVMLEFGFGLSKAEQEEPGLLQPKALAMAILAPPLYALGLWGIGFWIVTAITIPAVAWLLGYRNRLVLIAVTAGVMLAVGLAFPLVDIQLPSGALFNHS